MRCEQKPHQREREKNMRLGTESSVFVVYVKGQREYHCLCSEIHNACLHPQWSDSGEMYQTLAAHKHCWNRSL